MNIDKKNTTNQINMIAPYWKLAWYLQLVYLEVSNQTYIVFELVLKVLYPKPV